ncbi:MAG: carbohydrate porin [Rhodocyclales bacterium]|nr:carbohydrate porin [Rhodocyclales bacterium]
MQKTISRLLAAATMILGFSAFAAAEAEPDYGANTLTGDWDGLRNDWNKHGLALDLGYKWEMLRVTQGGLRKGGRPLGQFDLKAKADMEKLAGWEGGTVYVNFMYDGGGKTNRDHMGSLLGVSNTEVPVSTWRLFHAWVEQSFANDQGSLLAGIYPIDSEFQVLESAALFVQPPYGPSSDLALTRGPSIFNNSAFGLRAKWVSADKKLYAMGAVLDGIPGDPQHPQGTHIKFAKGDGAMQIVEVGFKPRDHISALPEKAVEGTETPAQADEEGFGKYAVGYWRYTAKVNDLVDVDASGNPERRRSAGWYALTEHTLWRWRTGDLAGFLRFGGTDGDSTAIKRFRDFGVRVRGLLPGREDDVFGLAHTRGGIGDKFRTSQAVAGVTATTVESTTEITYRIQVNNWLGVQPLMQRYRNPGANAAVPNATVIGVKVDLVL